MPDLKLIYFDFNGGRGHAARLALALGNVPFEDERVPLADWPAMKSSMPLQALPVLVVDGEMVTQSNAINRYVGQLSGLYPDDRMDALRCDEVMDGVEEIVTRIVATFGLRDEALRTAREALVGGPIPLFLGWLQSLLLARGGRYFVADTLTVADLKVYVWVQSLVAGILDHVPPDLPAQVAPELLNHCERLAADPAIAGCYV